MYSKQTLSRIRNIERLEFKKLKIEENKSKKAFNSKDILYTSDFTFKKYPHDGDSGELLLATSKYDKDEKYIVKHEYYDSACNEYMYSKISEAMKISVALVKLFIVNDKEKTFKSDFVCGIKYYEGSKKFKYEDINPDVGHIENSCDYYKMRGLEALLFEGDDIEVIEYKNKLYRIDTTDSFTIEDMDIYILAYNFIKGKVNIREYFQNRLIEKSDYVKEIAYQWEIYKGIFLRNYGEEYLKYFLEPFSLISKISDKKIKEWCDVLTWIYPNIVGKYYLNFLKSIKLIAKKFIKNNGY